MIEILRSLRDFHNVLLVGAPATGKSHLLTEVRRWFAPTVTTGFDPSGAKGFFPPSVPADELEEWLPSPRRKARRVWWETFHQGTTYRDFVTGIRPAVGGAGATTFFVHKGKLLEAVEHATREDGAALLIVDEINRGPAVAAFGSVLAAIERDKRLSPDGLAADSTITFPVINGHGEESEVGIPHHLYILAAMNEADTSIEPLDVAFRRRFQPIRIEPDPTVLRSYFGLLPSSVESLPMAPEKPGDVYEALVRAWMRINLKIELGRGAEFRIGHGAFMDTGSPPSTLVPALEYALTRWFRLQAHVAEVFFGDTRGMIEVLNARAEGTPFSVQSGDFADTPVERLILPSELPLDAVFPLLRHLSGAPSL